MNDALPEGASVNDNLVSINGRTGRHIKFTLTLGSAVYVSPTANASLNFTLNGGRPGDDVRAVPLEALPAPVTLTAFIQAENSAKIVFGSAGSGESTTNIDAGTQFNLTVEGPWIA
ncbi:MULTISPECIES: hypothetical protein [unclassified Sphingomonas]|uniref:hypothetical protein n=1 Tax=unclassified Sphingomonas TaxID=196159 RepID=UPI002150BEE3|nr:MULTISPECIES: hypothetical protein [unclassified Sphingomonas]MCR5870671.1 hypothetical protein [Sphingomonas sp. J344]UUY00993.1 hypothetical protein LRS08_08035 [Sphingomonas sp. J315]